MYQRKHKFIEEQVIVPFVDRLILLGVLPEPAMGFSVVWPDLEAQEAVVALDVSDVEVPEMAAEET